MLMIAERTGKGLLHPKDNEMMEKMGEELANVIEDFLRAVNVEALRGVKGIGKHTLSQYRVSPFLVASCRGKAPARTS